MNRSTIKHSTEAYLMPASSESGTRSSGPSGVGGVTGAATGFAHEAIPFNMDVGIGEWSRVDESRRPLRLRLYPEISARRRAEEAEQKMQNGLRRSALEWQITFDAIELPILIFNTNGRIEKINAVGKSLVRSSDDNQDGEVIGKTLDVIGNVEPWAVAKELLNEVRKTRTALCRRAVENLSGRTWEISANPTPDPDIIDGDEDYIVLVLREITSLVQMQASLHRNETMSLLGSLVSGVAHEVRNPLFGISSAVDAMEKRFGSEVALENYLEPLRDQVDRLSNLMKDLLDYGRPTKYELTPGDIPEVIMQAITASSPLAQNAKITIDNRTIGYQYRNKKKKSIIAPVLIDEKRLVQVYLNLLENAIQHSHQHGTVVLVTEEVEVDSKLWVQTSIVDCGPGFCEEDMSRLFEPFFTRRPGGTGLGLPIVQKIVEAHGGTVTPSNLSSGGAIITVRLPVVM